MQACGLLKFGFATLRSKQELNLEDVMQPAALERH
jgi:hypothetical protein